MLKRKYYIILIFVIIMAIASIKSSHIFAQPHLFTRVEEEDGSPSVSATKLKVSNSTLTDNGDGSVSLSTTALPSLSLTGNLTIDKHRPFIYFDPNSGDTQWYAGVLSDANGVSDDSFQIGTGTDPNSNAKFMITSSGYVGIGTTTPSYKLDVSGSNINLLRVRDPQGSVSTFTIAPWANTVWTYNSKNLAQLYWEGTGDGFFKLYATGTEKVKIAANSSSYLNSGNVGIGTTSPDTLLHAEKSTALTSTQQEVIRISATTTGTPAAGFGAGMGFELEIDANSAGIMKVVGGIYGVIEDPTLDSEDGAVIIKTMTAGATATEKWRVKSDGTIQHQMTGSVYEWSYQAEVADDGTFTLPSFTNGANGWFIIGNNEERAYFTVDDDGDTTLLTDCSANIVADANTDTQFCIGVAATNEPKTIKNRLGATKNIFGKVYYY